MGGILIQYQHKEDSSNGRPIRICHFITYSDVDAKVTQSYIKYDCGIKFSSHYILPLLKSFFGLSRDEKLSDIDIKQELNSKHVMTDYHGTVARSKFSSLIKRHPEHKYFTDEDGNKHELLEVGVNLDREFSRDAQHVEVKYGSPRFRIVVNIHFTNDIRNEDMLLGVETLDVLIAEIKEPEVVKEISRAKKVSLFNFASHGYEIAENSLFYYPQIAALLAKRLILELKNKLEQEQAAREIVEKRVTELETKIAQLVPPSRKSLDFFSSPS